MASVQHDQVAILAWYVRTTDISPATTLIDQRFAHHHQSATALAIQTQSPLVLEHLVAHGWPEPPNAVESWAYRVIQRARPVGHDPRISLCNPRNALRDPTGLPLLLSLAVQSGHLPTLALLYAHTGADPRTNGRLLMAAIEYDAYKVFLWLVSDCGVGPSTMLVGNDTQELATQVAVQLGSTCIFQLLLQHGWSVPPSMPTWSQRIVRHERQSRVDEMLCGSLHTDVVNIVHEYLCTSDTSSMMEYHRNMYLNRERVWCRRTQ